MLRIGTLGEKIPHQPGKLSLEEDTRRLKESPGELDLFLSISQFLRVRVKLPCLCSGWGAVGLTTTAPLVLLWYSSAVSFFRQTGSVSFRIRTAALCLFGTSKYHSITSSSGKLFG